MSNIEEKTIDGKSWRVSKFGAFIGLKLLTRVVKLVGPSLGQAVKDLETVDISLDSILSSDIPVGILMKAFGTGVEGLALRLDEDEVSALIIALLAETKCDGESVSKNFNILFAGEYLTLFKVVAFVLQTNYSNFLGSGKLGSLLKDQAEPEAKTLTE